MKVEKQLKTIKYISRYSGSKKYGIDEETFTKKAIANLRFFDKLIKTCSCKIIDVFVFTKIYLCKFFLRAFLTLRYPGRKEIEFMRKIAQGLL